MSARKPNRRSRVAPTVVVALPRPKGKHRAKRVSMLLTMHPSQLEALRRRSKRVDMALRTYVAALLDSDDEDVWTPIPLPTKKTTLRGRAHLAALVRPGVERGADTIAELRARLDRLDRVFGKVEDVGGGS